jgi:hypothetical protein
LWNSANVKTFIADGGRGSVTVSEAPESASGIEPEFVDVHGLRRGFGIRRSLAYQLLRDGLIRGVSLRRRNHVRGKRLFQVDSVRSYLLSRLEPTTNGDSKE